jgi:trehalose 6-phosphate synthase
MSLSLRFILPLFAALSLITYGSLGLVDRLMENWFIRDVEARAVLITNTLADPIEEALKSKNSEKKIDALFRRATLDERLYALAYCGPEGSMVAKSDDFPPIINCSGDLLPPNSNSAVLPFRSAPIHIFYKKLGKGGSLILVHDLSFMSRRSVETKKLIFWFFAILGFIISLITVVIAQLSWRGWEQGIRAVIRGEGILRPFSSNTTLSPELRPFLKGFRKLMKEVEGEKPIRDESSITWSPSALKELLNKDLAGDEVLVVANREPYIHVKKGDKIEVQVPASGLVSALEPIMRACSGTWVAHGSGSGDREVVDSHDRVRVPPKKPSYQIRRVWLSEEEEKGYYYGFSNEGLWPLCHMAHTRPIFRSQDWEKYVEVNRKFANAVIEEARTDHPVILVQDYHFALLPRMVKQKLPKAIVITFWHIPWPNPEAFGICPWREEILHGLLGSSILGFHTRFHSNNFMDTVDRFVEARIDRETNTITSRQYTTAVRQYPISIEWPSRWLEGQPSIPECRRQLRQNLGIAPDVKLGIGVDRLDYTKGILERFLAVERLLEVEEKWRGKFSFIQIASPSRSIIEHYRQFEQSVRQEADRINARFGKEGYKPIHLLVEHHNPSDVFFHYRGADICVVTSLHDGMNLVAKEFIAAREDEMGALVLSQFTGASRELPESLIVNPYDIDQCAAALNVALEMPEFEQRDRMRSMRNFVKENNVYRWAARMLIDANRMRQSNRFRERNPIGL